MNAPNLRLKEAREALGLKQRELAKSLSMYPSSYNQIESGRNNVSPRVLALLRLLWDINDRWLVTGEGNMFLPKKESKEDSSELRLQVHELQEELSRCKKIIDELLKR